MQTEKKNAELDQKVLCVRTYQEEDIHVWTAGKIYNAHQHRSGSWDIETDQGTIGLVPGSYLIDKFDDNFTEVTREVTFSDALRYCLEQGVITIGDCDGLSCAVVQTDAFRIALAFDDEEQDLIPQLEEDNDYGMITYYVSKMLDPDINTGFDWETEKIYEKILDACKNVPVLKEYLEQEIQDLKEKMDMPEREL